MARLQKKEKPTLLREINEDLNVEINQVQEAQDTLL